MEGTRSDIFYIFSLFSGKGGRGEVKNTQNMPIAISKKVDPQHSKFLEKMKVVLNQIK